MRRDAAPSTCDVVGCADPATHTYLRARDARLLEFSICAGHFVRLKGGEQPVVVAERMDLADLGAHPALILE